MIVQKGSRLSWKNVWDNQANDTHPPLYYGILHTISWIFAGNFDIWYAGIINLIFMLGILLLTERLALWQFEKRKVGLLFMAAFVVSAGMLQASTFLRMYVMEMFLGMCILLWHIHVFRQTNLRWTDAGILTVLTAAGALTHYYIIIFVVLEAFFYGLYMMRREQWAKMAKYLGALTAAGIASLVIFPAMWEHILGDGTRGKEAFQNMKATGGYIERLTSFLKIITRDLFGGEQIAILLVILLVVCLLLFLKKQVKAEDEEICKENIICILLPCAGYFLLVARVAAYQTGRYIWLIYPMCLYFVISILYVLCRSRIHHEKWQMGVLGIVILGIGAVSLKNCIWEYSYKGNTAVIVAKEYVEQDCIYVYGDSLWMCNISFEEVRNYNTLTYYKYDNLEALQDNGELKEKESFVVYVSEVAPEEVLETILEYCPNVSGYQELVQYAYTRTFYFE